MHLQHSASSGLYGKHSKIWCEIIALRGQEGANNNGHSELGSRKIGETHIMTACMHHRCFFSVTILNNFGTCIL